MDGSLRAWLERTGVTRAEAAGLVVAALGAMLALAVAVWFPLGGVGGGVDDDGDLAPGAEVPTVTPAPTATTAPVVVHVAGAVAGAGVIELPPGARVGDALAAAGGGTDEAALDALNLARVLVDGERIVVPTVEDVAEGRVGPAGVGTGEEGLGALPDGRIDLNAADADQLEELPGIGPVLAGRIIAHREANGPFEQSTALREVSGIGEATWTQLRELVGVTGEGPP